MPASAGFRSGFQAESTQLVTPPPHVPACRHRRFPALSLHGQHASRDYASHVPPTDWSEPGAAHVTGEALVSTVSSREACIDAVAAAPTATCPEPKIANMLAYFPSGNSPCYCQTGTDTTPGPVCAAAAAARRLPALRWPCCLVCACVLGSVPRLLTDALAPSVSPRTPPACVQILPHCLCTSAASSPSREVPRLLRLFFRAIWAKRVRNWAIARTVRLESTNLW